MSNSDTTGTQLTTRRQARGTAEAFDALPPPTPGSYWRLRRAGKRRHDERVRLPAMAAGTVLMLASVEVADGGVHAYHFAAHPSWIEARRNRHDLTVHADEFYTLFEPATDAEAERASELHALLLEMDRTKQAMMQPPPDAEPAALLTHTPAPSTDATGQALATPEGLSQMLAHADRLKADAERRAAWITKHSNALGSQGQILANYHQERAEAELARAQSQLHGVEQLLRTVGMLRLYTGEGIELMTLRDGAPAAVDEPLTLYQEILSLDEEAAILLDQGGLDHEHVDALVDALADPALLQRLIPAPRGAVLARFRATFKEFLTTKDPKKQARVDFANHQLSEESKRPRLLVRDGDKLWLIDAEAVFGQIKQLLPSTGEQDGYYLRERGFGQAPERLTREHLDYAGAQRKQLAALNAYQQVLVVLWGLHDRLELFGSALPRFGTWLDPAFQQRYLRLLSQDTLLGVSRPKFDVWQAAHNDYLAPGSWVAVHLRQALDEDRAPGAFSTTGRFYSGRTHYEQFYEPQPAVAPQDVLFARVARDTKGLYVEVPCTYSGYSRNVRDGRTVKLYVRGRTRDSSTPSVAPGVLALDRVRAGELDYYLESREQRRAYSAYLVLFRQARVWIAERDRAEGPLRARLEAAVREAKLPHDPDHLPGQITDALAVARTARRDRRVPAPRERGFEEYVNGALAALHALLSNHQHRIDAIARWAQANARQPLRLVLTGQERWRLYLEPTDAEVDPRLGRPAHAAYYELTFDAAGEIQLRALTPRLLRAVAGEQVIHDWNWEAPATDDDRRRSSSTGLAPRGAQEWLLREPAFSCSYTDAVATLDMAIPQSAAIATGIDLPALVATAVRHMRTASKTSVDRYRISIAIGSALQKGSPRVLLASVDALDYAYNHGDESIKQACRKAVSGIYAQTDAALKRLSQSKGDWQVDIARIDAVSAWRKQLLITDHVWREVTEEDCIGGQPKPRSKKDVHGFGRATPTVQVMAITPLAATLFPWLVRVTKGAIG